ncbi:MAG: hypothetical protein ACI9RY_000212, partial [Reinekea sp.]
DNTATEKQLGAELCHLSRMLAAIAAMGPNCGYNKTQQRRIGSADNNFDPTLRR